jgi:hypothetical protein
MTRLLCPRLILLAAGLCALTPAGCSGGKASAQGKVTFNGRTIKSGSLLFTGPDGNAIIATISEGRYAVYGVAAGTVKVGVSNPLPSTGVGGRGTGGRGPAGPAAQAPAPAPKDPDWFALPEKLNSPETSGFTVEMKSGANDIDLDFK